MILYINSGANQTPRCDSVITVSTLNGTLVLCLIFLRNMLLFLLRFLQQLNNDAMSHFDVKPLCPSQITNLETVLLLDMHCWGQSELQTSRNGIASPVLYLQSLSFLGRWSRQQQIYSPCFLCSESPCYRRKGKKVYTLHSCLPWFLPLGLFSILSMVSISESFFGHVFPSSWPKTNHSYSGSKS